MQSAARITGPRGSDLKLAKQLSGRTRAAGDRQRADKLANAAKRLLDAGEGHSQDTLARRQESVLRIVRTAAVETLDGVGCTRLIESVFERGQPMLACLLYDEVLRRSRDDR